MRNAGEHSLPDRMATTIQASTVLPPTVEGRGVTRGRDLLVTLALATVVATVGHG